MPLLIHRRIFNMIYAKPTSFVAYLFPAESAPFSSALELRLSGSKGAPLTKKLRALIPLRGDR